MKDESGLSSVETARTLLLQATVSPGAMDALQALGAAVAAGGVPLRTLDLVNLLVSQINGCGVCLFGDLRAARKHGETDDRLAVLAAWRDTPFFSDAERRSAVYEAPVSA